MNRYLTKYIDEFSRKKFVLMAGPRQVGKTTLAKAWLGSTSGYLNWDIPTDRERLFTRTLSQDLPNGRYVFDEIHKYARWKSLLKGLFDARSRDIQLLVTGSARLDVYQRGGDSLLGRYELLRLHPLSVGELLQSGVPPPPTDWLRVGGKDAREAAQLWRRLREFSGFPEPYLEQDPLQYGRWSARRRDLLVREDLRDLTNIRQLSLVEQMALMLPERVGAPFSLNNLREHLQVAHDTARQWFEALTRLYFCYVITPWSTRVGRSLSKEPKIYLWDWRMIEDHGARFENQVASHLLKAVDAWSDLGYGEFSLHYWRDQQKREVDFLVARNRKPIVLLECKLKDDKPSPTLDYCAKLIDPELPRIQLVETEGVDHCIGATRVVSASSFFAGLI
jgi:predicted AAA+ superfamily ATPase